MVMLMAGCLVLSRLVFLRVAYPLYAPDQMLYHPYHTSPCHQVTWTPGHLVKPTLLRRYCMRVCRFRQVGKTAVGRDIM